MAIPFSIILPTYNRYQLLDRAITSALNQTFPYFELIVIDDGSTDQARHIIESFSDCRLIYLREDCTKGVSHARNLGISHAQGKYIAFLDDDDELLPQFLERAWYYLQNKAHSPGLLWCGIQIIKNAGNNAHVIEHVWHVNSGTSKSLSFANELAISYGIIIKRTCFATVGTFDKNLKTSEDIDLLLRLLAHGVEYFSIPEVLIKIHLDARSSLSRSTDYISKARCEEYVVERNRHFLNKHEELWIHYHDSLASAYYRAGLTNSARKVMCDLIKRSPYRFRTIEKAIRFEIIANLRHLLQLVRWYAPLKK